MERCTGAHAIELREDLAPGEAVFTLIDPATVWVRAYIDEARAGDLAVGQAHDRALAELLLDLRERGLEGLGFVLVHLGGFGGRGGDDFEHVDYPM